MANASDDVYQSSRAPMLNRLGGAGTYATVGARLLCSHESSKIPDRPHNIGFIVHAGEDFPREVEAELQSWYTRSLILHTPERLTTRGRNIYQDEIRGS